MRTGLERGHPGALAAVESILEVERGDADLAGRVALEDLLRVVGAVVGADAGVIAPDNEMGAAVVAPDDGMEDRLARATVAHVRRHHGEHRTILRIVEFE